MHIETSASPDTLSAGTKVTYYIRISLIAALGGFLFGFETAVISGAEKTILPAGLHCLLCFFAGCRYLGFISEIFPNSVRSQGGSLGSFTHWIMAAIISWTFPVIVEGSTNGGFYSLYFTPA